MDQQWMAWLSTAQLGALPATNIAWAIAVALCAYLGMTLALRLAVGRARAIASTTSNHVDDVIVEVLGGTNRGLLALAALLIGVSMLDLPGRWGPRVDQLWFIAIALQGALWLNRGIGIGLRLYELRRSNGNPKLVSASSTLMSWGLRTLLWVVVTLAILSNLGVNVTAFVASLGVGGIAVALAVQNVLGDLFASLSIAADKPFEAGDFIVVGAVAGTVENVGLKTTRIRSLGGEQIVISNADLLKQTVNNYKRLEERRVVFPFGVTYDTTPEQAEAIPPLVKRIVEASGKLRFDRAHLKAFGDSSLDYELVYYVLDPSYNVYMDEQQRINLALMRELKAMHVDFAFPTRTVHLVREEEEREGEEREERRAA